STEHRAGPQPSTSVGLSTHPRFGIRLSGRVRAAGISSSGGPAISQLATDDSLELHFDDPRLFTDLLGQHDAHVRTVEQALGVRIGVSGTALRISGGHPDQALAGKVFGELYDLLKRGYPVYPSDVEYAVRILRSDRNAELKDIFLDTIYVSAHKR